MRALVGCIALLVVGCSKPPVLEDTDTDQEQVSFVEAIPLTFRDFEADDATLIAYVEALEAKEAAARKATDPPSPEEGDWSFQPPDPLFDAMLGDVTPPPDVDPENQMRVVVLGTSRHDYDTNLKVALEANQVCIESDSTRYYDRTYTGECSAADFTAGTCSPLRSANVVQKKLSFLAAGWYDLYKDFRELELSDGRRVLVGQSWIDKSYIGYGGGEFNQTYTIELWIEDGETTKRIYGIWAEIVIAGGIEIVGLVRDSLFESFERADFFGDDAGFDYCKEDRDAPNTRAEDEK